ncbi:head completion-like protein [Aeromonas phage phiAS5]|uniref:Head completion nuclease n=1 Tax=Aeromonas phage phiAS5 TaxID=879630 RepID=E1A283_9CAUD|nr:head closure [Aeromonas phage phiAS5]ADM80172.1 head completion-like protein [Aeromonas phage phiAS5]
MSETYKGKYTPEDKAKYRGDASKITYRSSWELFIMRMLDKNPEVKWWSSEETVIPYFSNADGKKRRYFMDFTVCWKNGSISLWEVKPRKETVAPIPPTRNTAAAKKRFMNEIYTYQVNLDKWQTASKICDQKGWRFNIITEDTLKRLGFKGVRE